MVLFVQNLAVSQKAFATRVSGKPMPVGGCE